MRKQASDIVIQQVSTMPIYLSSDQYIFAVNSRRKDLNGMWKIGSRRNFVKERSSSEMTFNSYHGSIYNELE